MKESVFMNRFVLKLGGALSVLLFLMFVCLIAPASVFSAEDRLVVEDGSGNAVFTVQDNGALTVVGTPFPVSNIKRTVSHTTGTRGVATFELISTGDMEDGFGPTFGFRISDDTLTAYSNIVAMQAARDGSDRSGKFQILTANNGALASHFVVNKAGNVGIGTTNPVYLIDTGGAYCDGSDWVSASSREYKQNIKDLSANEAMMTLKDLNPVKFNYKKTPDEENLGFIAEDVPDLVATKDRKGMSSMDVVAVLTKVVQEQQKTIAELSKKIDSLEQLAKLEGNRTLASVRIDR